MAFNAKIEKAKAEEASKKVRRGQGSQREKRLSLGKGSIEQQGAEGFGILGFSGFLLCPQSRDERDLKRWEFIRTVPDARIMLRTVFRAAEDQRYSSSGFCVLCVCVCVCLPPSLLFLSLAVAIAVGVGFSLSGCGATGPETGCAGCERPRWLLTICPASSC